MIQNVIDTIFVGNPHTQTYIYIFLPNNARLYVYIFILTFKKVKYPYKKTKNNIIHELESIMHIN